MRYYSSMRLNDLTCLYIYDHKIDDNLVTLLRNKVNKLYMASNKQEAQKRYKQYSPCMIVVDDAFENSIMVEFLQQIRKEDIKTAFIIVTNNQSNPYLTQLVELYLTKYIIKPYANELFISALNKCMEIIERRIYSNVKLGQGIIFNYETQSIIKENEVIVLNKKENYLINLFIKNPSRVISYEELEYTIWDNECTKDALKSLIRDFRRKTYKSILKNYSGIGYQLHIDVKSKG